MRKYYAGIDGGGTTTILKIRNVDDKKEATFTFGPFNINSIGRERFDGLLEEIFVMLDMLGECCALCIGAAGVSNMQVEEAIRATAKRHNFTGNLILKGDQEVALYGASRGETGAILISGTGSICIAIEKSGKQIRVGGRGHLIDDEGSAYAIGRDALSAYVRMEDGRTEKDVLYEIIKERLHIETIEDLIDFVYSVPDKSDIAALAEYVDQAARQGSKAAERIIGKAVGGLCELVKATALQTDTDELPIYLVGGMLTHDTILREKLIERIHIDRSLKARVCEPITDAIGGALDIAQDSVENA